MAHRRSRSHRRRANPVRRSRISGRFVSRGGAIVRHRASRRRANPFLIGRHWHRKDGRFSKRAGGGRSRRFRGHELFRNPFVSMTRTRSGRKIRRHRRLDGAFSKRRGGRRLRIVRGHVLRSNPRRRRRSRFAIARHNHRYANPSKRGKRRGSRKSKSSKRSAAARKGARTRLANLRRRAAFRAYALGAQTERRPRMTMSQAAALGRISTAEERRELRQAAALGALPNPRRSRRRRRSRR